MSAHTDSQKDSETSSGGAARDVLEIKAKPAAVKAKKWVVRGVPVELRQRVTQAAKQSGKSIGELVAEALTAHVQTLDDTAPVERDPLAELDALAHYVERRLFEIEGRMKTVESEDRLYRLVARPWIREVS